MGFREVKPTQEQRDRLHDHLYHGLAEVDRVCRVLGLRYHLIGGSLLGAIRHQAIIPWDDDIDVGMRRTDYDEFVRRAPELLGEGYHLESWRSDPGYHLMQSKLCVDGTIHIQDPTDVRRTHVGVAVDVFPLDYLPDGSLLRAVYYRLCRVLLICVGLRCGVGVSSRTGAQRAYALAGGLALRIIPTRRLIAACDRLCSRYAERPGRYIVPFSGMYHRREIVPSGWFVGDQVAPFGPLSSPIPDGWEPYLTQVYGDYMQPPPENARRAHPMLRLEV